jgi:hypothetical protein
MSVDTGYIGVIQANSLANTTNGFGAINATNGTTVTLPIGNIAYHAVPAGAPTYLTTSAQPAVQVPLLPALGPYLTGEYRIIAKGWEVINTTSDLNIQGLVTAYRQPFPDLDSASSTLIYRNANTALFGYPDVLWDVFPPQSPATALLLDGSKQWKAKEGCYIVDTLNSEEIPTGPSMACVAAILPTTDPAYAANTVAVFGTQGQLIVNIASTPAVSLNGVVPVGLLPTKFNHSGAYFQGLSFSTTLTLNAIFYIERFPTQQDSDLVVLAKHSCRNDSIARSLYSEIIREMPVGVPQRMNGMGEWFADAVSSAADFVAPVLGAIPTPFTQGLSGMAKMAGGVAKSLGSKRESASTYNASGSNTTAAPKAVAKVLKKAASQPKKKGKSATKKH